MLTAAKSKRGKRYKKESLPLTIREGAVEYRTQLRIGHARTCKCGPTHINCLPAKEWLKSQLGVWRFAFEARDIRDKEIHPATFPIALSRRVIELFTHQGELVLDVSTLPELGYGHSPSPRDALFRGSLPCSASFRAGHRAPYAFLTQGGTDYETIDD
jgi:hypothetical protein